MCVCVCVCVSVSAFGVVCEHVRTHKGVHVGGCVDLRVAVSVVVRIWSELWTVVKCKELPGAMVDVRRTTECGGC